MNWNEILGHLTVGRLVKLAEGAGFNGVTKRRKAELVQALSDVMDEALKYEILSLLSDKELRSVAAKNDASLVSIRRHELIGGLLEGDHKADTLPLDISCFMMPDARRLDLPVAARAQTDVELIPSRPTGAEASLLFEIQQRLRRPTLRRAFIVAANTRSPMLAQLLGQGLDDFIESAVSQRRSEGDGPLVTILLDGEDPGLDKGEIGQVLVSLARELPDRVALRLSSAGQRVDASVFGFEELLPQGGYFSAIVGSGGRKWTGERGRLAEASVLLSGYTGDAGAPSESIQSWVRSTVHASRRLDQEGLAPYGDAVWASRKIAYKRSFDTGHELRLKHLAEKLARRGRLAGAMFDPGSLHPPANNQMVALALASEAGCQGVLLCDEPGMGKGVQAGLILARELRRRRIFASEDAVDRRRALVVAPGARHADWCEQLEGFFGLSVDAREVDGYRIGAARDVAVTLVTPGEVAAGWERFQEADVLVVDDAHLCDDTELAALASIRRGADMCVVVTSTPVHSHVSDVWALAALADPDEAWDALSDVDEHHAELGEALRGMTARSHRDVLLDEALIGTRRVTEFVVTPSRAETAAFLELRCMRSDYLQRSGEDSAWAFVSLEEALESSPQAFLSQSCLLLGELEGLRSAGRDRDASYGTLESSSYFRRRLRSVRETLRSTCRPDASTTAKEGELLAQLATKVGKRVIVCTRYRATQQRLATVLGRSRLCGAVELLDHGARRSARGQSVDSFIELSDHRASTGGPAGVLICTDESTEGLSLAHVSRTLINYDIPINPQQLERRVSRIERYGKGGEVEVLNLAFAHVDGAPSLARRSLGAAKLFDMDEPQGSRRASLFEIPAAEIERALVSETEPTLALAEPGDDSAIKQFELLLEGGVPDSVQLSVERLQQIDRSYREDLRGFWERVSFGQQPDGGVSHHLFDRVQLALLQGQVGALCAAGTALDDCNDYHLVLGLRLLYESVESVGEDAPLDEQWLIEDEQVYLWAVGSSGDLSDWAAVLLAGGQVEAPPEKAATVVGEDVIKHLLAQKADMEGGDKDAVPLREWSARAPSGMAQRIGVADTCAEAMAVGQVEALRSAWSVHHEARLARLASRVERAIGADVEEEHCEDLREAYAKEQLRSVRFRHHVLGTQLFAVLHA